MASSIALSWASNSARRFLLSDFALPSLGDGGEARFFGIDTFFGEIRLLWESFELDEVEDCDPESLDDSESDELDCLFFRDTAF